MLKAYSTAMIALASVALLTLVQQFIAATFKNVVNKGVPGTPVQGGHDDFGYRVERAFYNSLENVVIFSLVVFIAMFAETNSKWVNILALVFLGARVVHMAVYYANIQAVRTLAFLVGFLCTGSITVMVLLKLLGM